MLWCALHLPDLPLQVFTQGLAEPGSLAVVSPPPRLRIVAATPAARLQGVTPGQRRSAARALAPDLGLLERDPELESTALTSLACWAGRFTSTVSLDPPATLLLEVQPTLRLFGGAQGLLERIANASADLGYSIQAAIAPTPLAARWLAQQQPGLCIVEPGSLQNTLATLPIELLQHEPSLHADTLEFLTGIGLRRIGDIRQLPRNGLAQRQAQAVIDLLDRAHGRIPDPRLWFVPPEQYLARLPLPVPSDQADPLLFAVRRLLAALGGWLDGRQAGLERFTLVLEFERLSSQHRGIARETRLDIVLGTLSRDMSRCQLLAREHLSRMALPAPVDAIRLEADAPRPLAPPPDDLFDPAAGKGGDPQLLVATLRARLGNDAVRCLAPHADHRPEHAWREADPLGVATPSVDTPAGPRPLWLLPEPRPIPAPAADRLLAGPERIESGWWDGADIARDYYVARRRDHSLVWIYRDGHPPHGWFLHGYFA